MPRKRVRYKKTRAPKAAKQSILYPAVIEPLEKGAKRVEGPFNLAADLAQDPMKIFRLGR